MEWVEEILKSQFVWGIVIGLLLSVVGAMTMTMLSKRERRTLAASFYQDLIGSITDLIHNLEDNRERHIIIEHEFLDAIGTEISVYDRNREHLVYINDVQLRKSIRNYFSRISVLLVQIQRCLRQFYDLNRQIRTETDTMRRDEAERSANNTLVKAHALCDKLREMRDTAERLTSKLESL